MTAQQDSRQKTITWQDPLAAAELGRAMPGLEYLTAIGEGRIPAAPISAHLGMRLVSVTDGEVVFAATPDESLYNPIGMIHGGVAATMLDSAVGCAVHTKLPAGVGYSSVELKVSYLKAIHPSAGEIRARGYVVKVGSRVGFAEAELRDEAGTLLATASGTCLVMRP
ncbi:PaaI family thioesterase [Amycolatopsis acidiphila]|uniref:PaaI family thioesterase n=1 Tax=Amycolatopsis acidiphila TaxID=715473 RepID=A0A557ZZM4_9PSEU|nr:PaaI family thioesterase [Amycolatopsis acidiphila]TVT17469.1 PaaI family thioesterase [Amycolatopsis acidiphila]UIJ62183.1 PaaI family thioesterase [Amycolatopsis acidiphila]